MIRSLAEMSQTCQICSYTARSLIKDVFYKICHHLYRSIRQCCSLYPLIEGCSSRNSDLIGFWLVPLSCCSLTGTVMNVSFSPSKCHDLSFISPPLFRRCHPPPAPPIRGFLRFCLLYQRDLHLKKPTVPPRYSTLACFRTNRPLPTCSSSSRLPSYHQVKLLLPSSKFLRVLKNKTPKKPESRLPAGVLALLANG